MSTFTTVVGSEVEMGVPGYAIESVSNLIKTALLADSPRGSKARSVYEIKAKPDDGAQYLVITIFVHSPRSGRLVHTAHVISEQPAVARQQYHANAGPGQFIQCRADGCGSDQFYDLGRSRDYNYHECATCGAKAQTLTETGASA